MPVELFPQTTIALVRGCTGKQFPKRDVGNFSIAKPRIGVPSLTRESGSHLRIDAKLDLATAAIGEDPLIFMGLPAKTYG